MPARISALFAGTPPEPMMASVSKTLPAPAGRPLALVLLAVLRVPLLPALAIGGGMPPAVLAGVAEPFFTTKPKGAGTGLGLAMARGFCEQSGGAMTIGSAPGVGTTVALWLPLARGRAAVAPARGAAPAPAPSAALLLVEDKAEVRAVLAAELAEPDHRVTQAADASGALALLAAGLRPDLLLTDLAMPGELDGLDLVLRARERFPRLLAVLLTGHVGEARPAQVAASEAGGPFALLHKPVQPEILLAQMARLLALKG